MYIYMVNVLHMQFWSVIDMSENHVCVEYNILEYDECYTHGHFWEHCYYK